MMDTSILFLATEKEGGLFDLDGTLPLIAIQFLALMFLLNLILYTPLLNVINDRNQYINKKTIWQTLFLEKKPTEKNVVINTIFDK